MSQASMPACSHIFHTSAQEPSKEFHLAVRTYMSICLLCLSDMMLPVGKLLRGVLWVD